MDNDSQPDFNDMDFDMFNHIQEPKNDEIQTTAVVAKSPSHAFVAKCIHPPSAIPSFDGAPTNDARSQVLNQYRNMNIMQNVMILDSVTRMTRLATAADLNTFKYAILITNGGRVLGIPFVYNATTNDMQQDYNNVDIQDAYNFENFYKDGQLYRTIYKSLTTYLNATFFNNTGAVVGSQFNPSLLFAGTILSFAASNPHKFAQWFKGEVEDRRLVRIDNRHVDFVKHRDAIRLMPISYARRPGDGRFST